MHHFHSSHLRDSFCCLWVIHSALTSQCFTVVAKHCMLEVSKRNDHNSHIVKWPTQQTIFDQVVNTKAWQLMDSLCLRVKTFKVSRTVPNHIYCLFVVDSVKNAVTSKCDEVMVLLDSESLDLWGRNQDVGVAAKIQQFCLNIPKGSRYR